MEVELKGHHINRFVIYNNNHYYSVDVPKYRKPLNSTHFGTKSLYKLFLQWHNFGSSLANTLPSLSNKDMVKGHCSIHINEPSLPL